MFKFLFSAYKQKKVFFPILLFLVLTAGIFLPRITLAGSSWLGLPTFADLIVSVSNLFSWIAYYICDYSGQLFSAVLNTIKDNKWAITRDRIVINSGTVPTVAGSIFLASWNIVKNWANMLIVLGVIGVAIATILRFRDYEAKKLLLPLIIVALLINFSVVFVGLMIDVSNVVITKVLNQNASGANDMIFIINGAWNNTALKLPVITTNEAIKYGALNSLFTIMYFVVGLVLFIFSLILIERYVILAFLFILSPLAFVFYAFPFPDAKKLWTNWWHHFIKWCFVGVGAGFTITIAMDMLRVFSASNRFFVAPSESTTPDLSGLILSLAIVILFLIIGLYMTIKSAGPAANMVMGAAKTGLAFATGAVVGGVLKATGVSGTAKRVKEAISDDWAHTKERWRLAPKGTRNLQQQARLAKDNAAKETAALTPEERQKIATRTGIPGIPFSEETKNRKIEAIKQMVKEKEIFNLSETQQKELLGYVARHEGKTDIFSQAGPSMVKFDKDKVKEKIRTEEMDRRKRGITGPAAIMSEAEAIKAVTAKAWSNMETPDIRKMSFGNPDDLMDLVANSSAKKLGKVREGLSSDREAKLKALLPRIQAEEIAARTAGDIARANALENAWLEIDAW